MNELATLVGQRTVFVDGPSSHVRVFEPGELVLVVGAFEGLQQRVWLESLVKAEVIRRGKKLWWLSDVDGWDLVVATEPSEELARAAKSITVWSRRAGGAQGERYGRDEKGDSEEGS